jgi:hypothetical protein
MLMADNLHVKHAEWNSRHTTARVSLLLDYRNCNRNCCFIHWQDEPTTALYTHNSTPDVIDGVCQGHRLTRACDCLLCTRLSSPAHTDRHNMTINLTKPTWLPQLQEYNRLKWFPSSPWRQTTGESRHKLRGDNRNVRRGAGQRHRRGHSGIFSQASIRGIKFGKAPGPKGVPNGFLRHLPERALTFVTKMFTAVLRRQYFPSAC